MSELIRKWQAYLSDVTLSTRELRQIQNYQETMLLSKERLWPDVPFREDASDSYIIITRLREMAVALSASTTPCYVNDRLTSQVISGLKWLYEHRFNDVRQPYGNWWYWEIGVPIALLETIIILVGHLDRELIERLLRTADKYVGDPAFHAQYFIAEPRPCTGANLVWKVTAAALSAVIQGAEEKLYSVRSALLPVFHYAKEGDGFYEDGSFIQHDKYAYTGGYGVSLLKDLVRLTVWLHRTPWELPAEAVDLTFRWIRNAYVPLMFRGMLLDMSSGREIARSGSQNHESGHSVITSCLRFSRVLDAPRAAWLLSKAKRWILADNYKSYVETAPPDTSRQAKLLLEHDGLPPASEDTFCKLFAGMDRAVLHGPGFVYSVSMYSDRIGNYESINGENLKGWYTSQGMTGLYDNDLGHYGDAYWPTVDPYRLPGITVTDRLRRDGVGQGRLSTRAFVGGAVLQEKYGAIAMELEDTTEDGTGTLTGLKSWFLFGDRIVALGSDITASHLAGVKTIIENRKFDERRSLVLLADGDPICNRMGQQETTIRPGWIHLSNRAQETDIGYVFPKGGIVQALREVRQGSWRDINRSGSADAISRGYATIWFDHGTAAAGAEYAYVILPGRKASATARFAERLPIRIVESSRHAHAVEDIEQGLFAAHFWQPRPHTSGSVSCNGRVSLVLKQDHVSWSLAVADPTQSQRQPITLELDLPAGCVLYKSEKIHILNQGGGCGTTLQFVPAGAAGGSFHIAFKREE